MTHLSVPSFWRLNKAKYGLVGAKCKDCDEVVFPPRAACPACGSANYQSVSLPDSGQILTWTTVHVAPDGVDAPYTIALIRLGDGTVVTGQIVGDLGKLNFDAPVKAVFRRLGENDAKLLLYGFKFVLI